MISRIKPAIRRIPGLQSAWRAMTGLNECGASILWRLGGMPPGDRYSFYKRRRIIVEGMKYGCSTFVETGTYLGGTVQSVRHHFAKVYSVELSKELFQRADKRFRNTSNVKILHGDSGIELNAIIPLVVGRAIFWLDGHYSGGNTACGATSCPLVAELDVIGRHERTDHVILIDDARLFGADPAYPTLGEAERMLLLINPTYQVTVEHDCIVARPQTSIV